GPELDSPADNPGGGPAASAKEAAVALPSVGPTPEPVQVAGPAPAASPPANRGEQLLAEAKALYTNGNYPAARQLANQAKAGKFGVEAQADELLAQIGLTEQGGALNLYEEALAAMRKGDSARARALLTEVAAAGESLGDEGLRAKVQGLLQKLAG